MQVCDRLAHSAFAAGGTATRVMFGIGGIGGFVKGPFSNVAGDNVNYNVAAGSVTMTGSTDAKTGEKTGLSFGPSLKAGASVCYSKTEVWSLANGISSLIEKILGKGKSELELKSESNSEPKTSKPIELIRF